MHKVPAQVGRSGITRDGGDAADPVEGLVPSGGWGFKSPLRHHR
jgi:hypothetical protein